MKGYIYTMFRGADPGNGWNMTDPIFSGKVPTLGACVPQIRRAVTPGDYVFVVSGKTPGVQQYVVGGLQVAEKIHALKAFELYPDNRQELLPDGSLKGNIITRADGTQNPFDYHTNYEARLENYIVGRNPLALAAPREIAIAREQTLTQLNTVFGRQGTEVREVLGRWRRLDSAQVEQMLQWMHEIKSSAAQP